MRIARLLIASCLLLAALPVMAGARADLAAFTRALQGLDGNFAQTVFDSNGQAKESSTGRLAMAAPDLFRWEYRKPYEQLIVADGKTIWVYDPDLSQVTRRPQGNDAQNSPLAALLHPAQLERDYTVVEAPDKGGLRWLTLAPKGKADDAGFRDARLGFDDAGLARMEVLDILGQRTEISFTGWQRNPGFKPATFRFVPAKGVDVVGEG